MMPFNILPNILILQFFFLSSLKSFLISIFTNKWEQMQLSNIREIVSTKDV